MAEAAPQPQWSVQVVAHWNKAILTPAWIGRTLFQLPADAPPQLQIEVPLNVVAPLRVRHEGLVVMAGEGRLVAECERSYEALERAKETSRRAVEALPRTPYVAAGFNVVVEPERVDAAAFLRQDLDTRLERLGYRPLEQVVNRIVEWRGGRLLISISREGEQPPTVVVNFERRSAEAGDLANWLAVPIDDVRTEVERLVTGLR